jgi:hypothetical protein
LFVLYCVKIKKYINFESEKYTKSKALMSINGPLEKPLPVKRHIGQGTGLESPKKLLKIDLVCNESLSESFTFSFQPRVLNEAEKRYTEISKALAGNYVSCLGIIAKCELDAIRSVADHEVLNPTLRAKLNDFLRIFNGNDDSIGNDSIQKFQLLQIIFNDVLCQANEQLGLGSVEERIVIRGLLFNLRKIAHSALTQISARRVNSMMVNFIKSSYFPRYQTADIMFGKLVDTLPLEGLRELAVTWDKAYQLTQKNYIADTGMWNIPNQTFNLEFPSNETLTFFRFGCPSMNLNGLTPLSIYRAMLEAHDKMDTRHMDLSLLRMKELETEVQRTSQRLQLQDDFPGTLIAWAFDFYSDFSTRDDLIDKKVDIDIFISEFMDSLFTDSNSPFKIPYMADKLETFKEKARGIIISVHEDFFDSQESLSGKMTTAFIDITVVRLLEYFCELYKPQTCDTACFSHIDRGMELMTVLYYYLLIQNGKHQDEEHLQYMEEMIFAPSMFFEKRPTHPDVMTRLLNTLSFMQPEEVVERINTRKTYFSNAALRLPE